MSCVEVHSNSGVKVRGWEKQMRSEVATEKLLELDEACQEVSV